LQAILAARPRHEGGIFLGIDLRGVLDIPNLHGRGVLDIEMRRVGGKRVPAPGSDKAGRAGHAGQSSQSLAARHGDQ